MSEFNIDTLRALFAKYSEPPIIRMPRIIESSNVYIIHIRVRGIQAGHKPNRNRPYYRRVKTVEYPIYYIKAQNVYTCHPLMAAKLREKIRAEAEASQFTNLYNLL